MQSGLVSGFSDIRKSIGDFLLKSLLLNGMGSKRKLTETERLEATKLLREAINVVSGAGYWLSPSPPNKTTVRG